MAALRIKWGQLASFGQGGPYAEELEPDCPTCGDARRVDGGVKECPDCVGKLVEETRRNLCGLSPDVLAAHRLESFDFGVLHRGDKVKATLMGWSQTHEPPWLALSGPLGTGKTHLAIGLVAAALERGERVAFYRVDTLMSRLKMAMGKEDWGFAQELEALGNLPLLALDDLAAPTYTAWEADTLFALLDTRYLGRKPMVFTMDVRPQDFPLDRIARRMGDTSVCLTVGLDGDDYRARKARLST